MAVAVPSTFTDLDGLLGSAQLPTLIGGPRTFVGDVTHGGATVKPDVAPIQFRTSAGANRRNLTYTHITNGGALFMDGDASLYDDIKYWGWNLAGSDYNPLYVTWYDSMEGSYLVAGTVRSEMNLEGHGGSNAPWPLRRWRSFSFDQASGHGGHVYCSDYVQLTNNSQSFSTAIFGGPGISTAGPYGVTEVELTAGGVPSATSGSGYTNGTGYALAFSGGGGTGATGTFDVVGGKATNVSLTSSGRDYTSSPTASFAAAGAGTGATASVGIGSIGLYLPTVAAQPIAAPKYYVSVAGIVETGVVLGAANSSSGAIYGGYNIAESGGTYKHFATGPTSAIEQRVDGNIYLWLDASASAGTAIAVPSIGFLSGGVTTLKEIQVGSSFTRIGYDRSNNGLWQGYNVDWSTGAARLENTTGGVAVAIALDNNGWRYEVGTGVAGTALSPLVLLSTSGTLSVKPNQTAVPILTMFDSTYGLGMDGNGPVLFTGSRVRIKDSSVAGTTWADFSAAGLALSGGLGVNGASVPAKAASPGTAAGTDAAVINAIATILRNMGGLLVTQPLRGDGKSDDTAALMALFRSNSPGLVTLPPGRYMTTGLNLAGLSCAIVGAGDSTTIAALPGQAGPVLDFTGYLSPNGACAIRTIGGFSVEGDGTAGVAKAGIRLGTPGVGGGGAVGLAFRDLAVMRTGGPGLDAAGSQLCHFERLVLNTPVDCVANDVPYICGAGACNGNRFLGIGLRSMTPAGDCPRGGAARFLQSSGDIFCPYGNLFQGWWIEYLHPSDGATVFALQGSMNAVRDFSQFDVTKEPGAKGTSMFRLLNPDPGKENYGANTLESFLYGNYGNTDFGVDVYQPRNAILGPKGRGGQNVVLRTGATGTAIDFLGAQNIPDPAPAVIGPDGRAAPLDPATTIFDRAGGSYSFGAGQQWSSDGLFPGFPVKASGAGGGVVWWQGAVLRAKPNKPGSKATVLAK